MDRSHSNNRGRLMKTFRNALLAFAAVAFGTFSASAGPLEDCAGQDSAKAISGCTTLLKNKKTKKSDQSLIYTKRGLAYFTNGDSQKAIKDFEQGTALDPRNFQAFQGLGFALQRTGLYPEAVAAFDKAIALNPSDHVTISYRGYTHLLVKDHAKALKDFDAAAKLAPKDASYQTARGDALKSQKAFPLALAAYSKAITLDPSQYGAYEGRGLAQLAVLDVDKAIADFSQSITLNPNSSLSYAGRAQARYLRDDIEGGLLDAEMALKLAPDDVYALIAMGHGYFAKKDFKKAQELYAKAQAIDSTSARASRNNALATLELGDADGALVLADTALQTDPTELAPHTTRGHIILSKGRVDEAIQNFEKGLSANNLDGEAYRGLGLAYLQKGDVAKARLNLEESLKPFRLYEFQRKRAEQTLQELDSNGGDKVDLEVVTTEQEKPVVKAPIINIDPGKRVALVIGNGSYQNANNLPNPTRDSAAIATALKGLGFEVLEGKDLDHAAMQGLLKDFAEKATQADVALFYYAGHGMQVGDKNYLVPVDAKLEKATAVDFELVDVNKSVVQFMGGEERTGIIILDACRDNPLSRSFARSFGKTRSGQVTQGMAPMNTDDGGLLIAFATSPGNVAEDGDGQNSPFTTALLQHMKTPGLELEQMMKRVKKDVFAATDKRQQPWVNSALRDEVYLAVQ
jgi:tetratricopeptide (TPR) repeat protein